MKLCPVCSKEYDNEHEMCAKDGVPLVHLDTGTADRAQDLIGHVVDGRYRIERIVGRGGMGTVYACRHVVVGKAFAMKVLRSGIERSEEILQRFIREAQAANAVHSRHICEMTDFGQLPNGAFYVVMELLHGMSFTRALREEKLERADIKDVFIQIAETLDKTHRANIIHRDLKPDNVVLENKETGGYFVKLVDFGIAKIMENKASNLTETGVILGTPYYMSPEQARGDQLDNRSDIYALGVMMYRAFAGRLPFVADTAMGVLTRHLTQQPELPSRLADMDQALERLILRCLEKKPVDRFQSMDDVAEALRSVPDTYQSPRNNPTIDERSGALMAAQLRDGAGSDQAPISMPTPTEVATPQALAARQGDPPGQVVDGSEAPPVAGNVSTEHPSVIPPPLPTPGGIAQASATPADASGPVPSAGPGGAAAASVGGPQPQVGSMASGQLPVGGALASGAQSPPHGVTGAGANSSGLYASDAVPPASTGQPAMGALPDAGSTGDPLPSHLQGEAPTNRGVVSSRTSARSLRDPRGRSALWIGVAVLMAVLGGTAAYAMFGPTTAPVTGSPSTQPTSSAPEETEDLSQAAPWDSAAPLETAGSADPSAEPDPDSSAAPATSSSGKPTTRPTGGVRPPPPEEEEEELPPEIRSPFD